jgi:hypothetical protein
MELVVVRSTTRAAAATILLAVLPFLGWVLKSDH